MSVSEESSRDASGKEKRIVRTAMGEEEDRGDALAQKVATLADGEIAIMSAGISHLILCRWDLERTDSAEGL
jgi:hypothetical protein